ncbi:uncharacterized protein TNCV_3615311 [Trichonephila clavipes]|nr:uncharacterized protein TNCV_3615311 [Trichonephila clavipes]
MPWPAALDYAVEDPWREQLNRDGLDLDAPLGLSQTQQCSLNSSLGDTFGSPLVHFGGQLLNGCARTHLCNRRSPLSSMARGAPHLPRPDFEQSHFAMHVIFDTFTTAACEQFTKLSRFEMLPPLVRKPMIMPIWTFWTSDKSLRFCITSMIEMFSKALRHPLYTLNCTVLPPAFCDWLFNSDVESTWWSH